MDFSVYFDIIICFIVVVLALKGAFNGFIRETFSAIGIIGGIWIASRYNVNLGKYINEIININSITLLHLLSFMIILASIWIASVVISEITVKFVRFMKLGVLDRVLGVFVSGAKIFIILSIILFTFSQISLLSRFTSVLQRDSVIYQMMINVSRIVINTDFLNKTKEQAMDSMNKGVKKANQSLF